MKKLMLLAVLMALTGKASAALVQVNNLTVNSYKTYFDGSSVIFMVKVNEDITGTGCAYTDNNNVFSYWAAGAANMFHQQLSANVMAADAQERKINILYDNSQCAATVGRMLYGVEVQPAP